MKSATHNGVSEMNAIVEHTYTVAGTSLFEGEVTYRFANSVKRMKVLERNGHKDVVFWELPRPMVLKDAVAFLKTKGVVAQLPYGQRKVQNTTQAAVAAPAEQHDAHVVAHNEWLATQAAKKADFVARMAAARAAKRLLKQVEGEGEAA
jgi:hypothetical protein